MRGFGQLFWGFLLVFLDFRINGFDILPDIIGFILVYLGLSALAEVHERFLQAKKITIPLLVLSIFDLFPAQAQPGSIGPSTLWGILLAIVVTVLNLLLVHQICSGIAELAKQVEKHELAAKAQTRWTFFLWISIAGLVIIPFAMVGPNVAALFAIPVAILGLISYILLLALFYEADRSLPLSYEG